MTNEKQARKERLRNLLEQNGESQASLARFCGVSTAAVAQWVTKGSFGYESAVKIASFFGVSFDWLYKGEGGRFDATPKSIGDYAPAEDNYVAINQAWYMEGEWKVVEEQPPFAFASDVLTLGASNYTTDYCRLTRALGDRMAPKIENGDYVLISESNRSVIDGSIYALTIDGRFLFGRLAIVKDGLTITFDNPSYKPETYEGDDDIKRIHIVGRVIFVARAL